jgi:hypothetical protein
MRLLVANQEKSLSKAGSHSPDSLLVADVVDMKYFFCMISNMLLCHLDFIKRELPLIFKTTGCVTLIDRQSMLFLLPNGSDLR